MAWYSSGTVSVTNGVPTVTLSGGDALLNISPDDGFVGPDGRTYPILTIGGTGTFTLADNYLGPTASAQDYAIIPVADFNQLRSLLISVNTLITEYQDITLNAGVGLFEAGTASLPGVRANDHEGTGLVWNADGSLSISVDGSIVATFNVGGLDGPVTEAPIDGFYYARMDGGWVAFDPDSGGGQVNSITQGTGIAVNAADPVNPTVSLSSGAQSSLSLADSAVQPADLGGAASLNVGTTAGTVAAGDHTHPDATTSVAGFMSGADKTKLNGIATGATANTGTVTSVAMSGGTTGLTFTGSPVTGSGTVTAAGTLAIGNGGTGATTAAAARTNIGAVSETGSNSLSGAYRVNAPLALTGTSIQPDLAVRNMFTYANAAAFTLTAPASNDGYTAVVEITNAASGAGAITASGFNHADTSAFATTANARFLAQITSFGSGKKYLHIVKASA